MPGSERLGHAVAPPSNGGTQQNAKDEIFRLCRSRQDSCDSFFICITVDGSGFVCGVPAPAAWHAGRVTWEPEDRCADSPRIVSRRSGPVTPGRDFRRGTNQGLGSTMTTARQIRQTLRLKGTGPAGTLRDCVELSAGYSRLGLPQQPRIRDRATDDRGRANLRGQTPTVSSGCGDLVGVRRRGAW